MKIALLGKFFGWGGGAEFLRNVASGLLTKQQEHNLSLYLLLPMHRLDIIRVVMRSVLETVKRKRPTLVLSKPDFYAPFLDYFKALEGRVEIVYYINTQRDFLHCLKRIGADIAMPVHGSLGPKFPIPWIGYTMDFQHKYYPENFTTQECFNRDIHFATVLRDSKTVIVNSRAVKNDIYKFYPYVSAAVYALPFAPVPSAGWFDAHESDVSVTYGLPDSYFLISNQFWVHKDHLTAFKALLTAINCHIVCTGEMIDYNHPGHVDELRSFILSNGLEGRVTLLGHIPKRDQIEIMKKSRAVIQPSLFEGGPGGGSVFDAAALGVPVILSDIDINREVEIDTVFFFEAGNCEALAKQMMSLSERDIERVSTEALLSNGKKQAVRLGESLMAAISHTMQ
jgi:glycosyltransferase involved in cell wall biosynthesis